jgi:hypothetical protein
MLIGSPVQMRYYDQQGIKEDAWTHFHHDVADPAWFGLHDFKVLLLEKPGGAPKAPFTEPKGYRWYSQK